MPLPLTLPAELFEQSLAVVPTLDMRDIGARLLAPLVHGTRSSRSSIMLVNPGSGRLRVVAGVGIRPDIIGRDAEWRPNSISEWVFRKRQGLILNGKVSSDTFTGTAEESIESAMCLPLETLEGVIGVVNLARISPSPLFGDGEMQAVQGMLPPVATALERASFAARAERTARELREASVDGRHTLLQQGLYEGSAYEFGLARVPSMLEGGVICERATHRSGHHSLITADLSDHGPQAVLTAAWMAGLFTGHAAEELAPAALTARLHAEFMARFAGSRSAASWTARLSANGQVVSCNAGAPPALWVPSDDSPVVRLEAGGPPIGSHAQATWSEENLRMLPGDLIVVLSAGLLDSRNVTGQGFGAERVIERVCEMRRHPLDRVARGLIDEVLEWNGRAVPTDDLAVLALRYHPGD